MNALVALASGLSLGFMLGAFVGVVVTFAALERADRFRRTGRVAESPRSESRIPGGEFRMEQGRPPTVEADESQAAFERVLDRGTEHLMAMEPALTRDQARDKARRALEETGSFAHMGGIPSA